MLLGLFFICLVCLNRNINNILLLFFNYLVFKLLILRQFNTLLTLTPKLNPTIKLLSRNKRLYFCTKIFRIK